VEIEEVIFARVSGGAFAGSGDEDAEYVAGLRAAVVAALKYGLEGIERGEEWVGPIPLVVSEQARRAARSGVGLDTVLRRYVVGHTLLGEFVMEEADRGDFPVDRGALREVLRVQAVVLDRLLEAITAEHADEMRRAGRSPEQRRAERVRKLLDGGMIERSELDYELDAWHLGMIIVGAGAADVVRQLASAVNRRLLSVPHGEQSVWVWLGGRERFAFADVKRVLTGAVPLESVMLALGEPAEGLQGWRLTHQQAQAALVVALCRPRPLTRYADVALLATALKDEVLARALADIYLSPLDDSRNRGPVLRGTLRAYLATERNVSSAAIKLKVSRSTVEDRLRTIEERLGRTLHPFPPELEVALELDGIGILGERG
jgi:DNA-binding Lrp family transcriptional regulator